MSFELLDNLGQVALLGGASVAAGALALRDRDRRCFILALAYACFAMGTLFYVLYLAIFGRVPQVFYVSELSWLASYLFYLSLEILRAERQRVRFAGLPALGAAALAAASLRVRIFGPSWLMAGLFALTAGAIVYLALYRLRQGPGPRAVDAVLLCCVVLQVALYAVSDFTRDYTRFNAYFAVDLLLTAAFLALLPLSRREVRGI